MRDSDWLYNTGALVSWRSGRVEYIGRVISRLYCRDRYLVSDAAFASGLYGEAVAGLNAVWHLLEVRNNKADRLHWLQGKLRRSGINWIINDPKKNRYLIWTDKGFYTPSKSTVEDIT